MRALCAPDKFRGTLTAAEAAAALAAGFRDAGVDDVDELPLADGGEGTLDVLLAALGGEQHEAEVAGPDGAPIRSSWGLLPDGSAVVELARASGLALVAGANDPVTATTRGTGELIAAAAAGGATGSSSAQAARRPSTAGSAQSRRSGGRYRYPSPWPATSTRSFSTRPASSGRRRAPARRRSNCSPGGSRASAAAYRDRSGVDVTTLPGAGAAGGFAGGLAALGASLRPGFAAVAEAVGFAARLESGDDRGHRRGQARRDEPRRQGRGRGPARCGRARHAGCGRRGRDRGGRGGTASGSAARRLSRPARRLAPSARAATLLRSCAAPPGSSCGISTLICPGLSRATEWARPAGSALGSPRSTGRSTDEMNARRLGAGATLLAIGVAALALAAASSAGQTARVQGGVDLRRPAQRQRLVAVTRQRPPGRAARARREGEDDVQGARPRGSADLPGDREPDP